MGEIVIAKTDKCETARRLAGVRSDDLVFTAREIEFMRNLPARSIEMIGMVKREFPNCDIIDVAPIETGCFARFKDKPISYPPRGQGTLF